jgi:8-oxo-dGTP pyrophosphatase MutT (NUDIX family)
VTAPPQRRPRDAASLVLIRRASTGPEVLMGRRSAGHVFMPHRFVFPGGRVDPADHRVPAATALSAAVTARLGRGCRSAARPHALAIAAVRETYEETGLVIGRPSAASARLDERHWAGFRAAGLAPALDRLVYVFRAVTPPGQVRRFDARFFLAELDAAAPDTLAGNGELENVAWLPLAAALGLPLSEPTGLVLREVVARLEAGAGAADRAVPVLLSRRGRSVTLYE